MSALNDLMKLARERWEEGTSPELAAMAAAQDNPVLAQAATIDQLLQKLNNEARKKALYPPHFDQYVFELGPEYIQVPDRTVRIVDPDAREWFTPRRFATTAQAQASLRWVAETHDRERRAALRDLDIEIEAEAKMKAAGIDTTKTHDEIRHKNTTCWRCEEGYRAGDPFQRGHKVARAIGGDESDGNIGWEHESCNLRARANP